MKKGVLGDGIGTAFTYYDPSLSFFYTVGRGDSKIDFYELDPASEHVVKKVGDYSFGDNTKLFNMMPKWSVDCTKNELGRCIRINQKNQMDYASFSISSATQQFEERYYPAFASFEPSNNTTDWKNGTDVPPKTMTLKPKKAEKKKGLGLNKGGAAKKEEEKKQSDDPVELKQQIDALKKELEASKAALTLAQGGAEDLSTKPILGYWKVRGLGQQVRCMLVYCGVDFDEERYEVQGEAPDWDLSQWTDKKFNLGMEYPNLPYLIDGETKLSETVAIMKYIAKKYKPSLLGSSAATLGEAEMIYAQVWQLIMAGRGPLYAPLEEGKTLDDVKQGIEETVTPQVEKIFEAMGGSQWIAGDELTWVDFAFAEALAYFAALLEGRLELSVPASSDYLERFMALEAIKAYYAEDRCLKAPFNNKQAKILNE